MTESLGCVVRQEAHEELRISSLQFFLCYEVPVSECQEQQAGTKKILWICIRELEPVAS